MESGDLRDWYLPGALGSPNFSPPNAGGGEFDSGSFDPASVVTDFAHSGRYSAKLSIDASASGGSGVRLMRWVEPQTHNDLYYSVWYYFPQTYTFSQWSNYFQWKSRIPGQKSDPILFLVAKNRPNGDMYFAVHWWSKLTIEGPHSGEFGFRPYDQTVRDIPVGQWFQIEARYVCAGDFTGRLTVWQDGVQLLDLTGIRTRYPDGDCHGWSVNNYGEGIAPNPVVVYVDGAAISTGRVGADP